MTGTSYTTTGNYNYVDVEMIQDHNGNGGGTEGNESINNFKQKKKRYYDRLKGGDYNGQRFSKIGKEKKSFFKRLIELFNMTETYYITMSVSHAKFVGPNGEFANYRNDQKFLAESTEMLSELLGPGYGFVSLIKGDMKTKEVFSKSGILAAYLYLISEQAEDSFNKIIDIKDKYDELGGNKGVYIIKRVVSQGNRMGGVLYSSHIDIYDYSTKKHLGSISNFY